MLRFLVYNLTIKNCEWRKAMPRDVTEGNPQNTTTHKQNLLEISADSVAQQKDVDFYNALQQLNFEKKQQLLSKLTQHYQTIKQPQENQQNVEDAQTRLQSTDNKIGLLARNLSTHNVNQIDGLSQQDDAFIKHFIKHFIKQAYKASQLVLDHTKAWDILQTVINKKEEINTSSDQTINTQAQHEQPHRSSTQYRQRNPHKSAFSNEQPKKLSLALLIEQVRQSKQAIEVDTLLNLKSLIEKEAGFSAHQQKQCIQELFYQPWQGENAFLKAFEKANVEQQQQIIKWLIQLQQNNVDKELKQQASIALQHVLRPIKQQSAIKQKWVQSPRAMYDVVTQLNKLQNSKDKYSFLDVFLKDDNQKNSLFSGLLNDSNTGPKVLNDLSNPEKGLQRYYHQKRITRKLNKQPIIKRHAIRGTVGLLDVKLQTQNKIGLGKSQKFSRQPKAIDHDAQSLKHIDSTTSVELIKARIQKSIQSSQNACDASRNSIKQQLTQLFKPGWWTGVKKGFKAGWKKGFKSLLGMGDKRSQVVAQLADNEASQPLIDIMKSITQWPDTKQANEWMGMLLKYNHGLIVERSNNLIAKEEDPYNPENLEIYQLIDFQKRAGFPINEYLEPAYTSNYKEPRDQIENWLNLIKNTTNQKRIVQGHSDAPEYNKLASAIDAYVSSSIMQQQYSLQQILEPFLDNWYQFGVERVYSIILKLKDRDLRTEDKQWFQQKLKNIGLTDHFRQKYQSNQTDHFRQKYQSNQVIYELITPDKEVSAKANHTTDSQILSAQGIVEQVEEFINKPDSREANLHELFITHHQSTMKQLKDHPQQMARVVQLLNLIETQDLRQKYLDLFLKDDEVFNAIKQTNSEKLNSIKQNHIIDHIQTLNIWCKIIPELNDHLYNEEKNELNITLNELEQHKKSLKANLVQALQNEGSDDNWINVFDNYCYLIETAPSLDSLSNILNPDGIDPRAFNAAQNRFKDYCLKKSQQLMQKSEDDNQIANQSELIKETINYINNYLNSSEQLDANDELLDTVIVLMIQNANKMDDESKQQLASLCFSLLYSASQNNKSQISTEGQQQIKQALTESSLDEDLADYFSNYDDFHYFHNGLNAEGYHKLFSSFHKSSKRLTIDQRRQLFKWFLDQRPGQFNSSEYISYVDQLMQYCKQNHELINDHKVINKINNVVLSNLNTKLNQETATNQPENLSSFINNFTDFISTVYNSNKLMAIRLISALEENEKLYTFFENNQQYKEISEILYISFEDNQRYKEIEAKLNQNINKVIKSNDNDSFDSYLSFIIQSNISYKAKYNLLDSIISTIINSDSNQKLKFLCELDNKLDKEQADNLILDLDVYSKLSEKVGKQLTIECFNNESLKNNVKNSFEHSINYANFEDLSVNGFTISSRFIQVAGQSIDLLETVIKEIVNPENNALVKLSNFAVFAENIIGQRWSQVLPVDQYISHYKDKLDNQEDKEFFDYVTSLVYLINRGAQPHIKDISDDDQDLEKCKEFQNKINQGEKYNLYNIESKLKQFYDGIVSGNKNYLRIPVIFDVCYDYFSHLIQQDNLSIKNEDSINRIFESLAWLGDYFYTRGAGNYIQEHDFNENDKVEHVSSYMKKYFRLINACFEKLKTAKNNNQLPNNDINIDDHLMTSVMDNFFEKIESLQIEDENKVYNSELIQQLPKSLQSKVAKKINEIKGLNIQVNSPQNKQQPTTGSAQSTNNQTMLDVLNKTLEQAKNLSQESGSIQPLQQFIELIENIPQAQEGISSERPEENVDTTPNKHSNLDPKQTFRDTIFQFNQVSEQLDVNLARQFMPQLEDYMLDLEKMIEPPKKTDSPQISTSPKSSAPSVSNKDLTTEQTCWFSKSGIRLQYSENAKRQMREESFSSPNKDEKIESTSTNSPTNSR